MYKTLKILRNKTNVSLHGARLGPVQVFHNKQKILIEDIYQRGKTIWRQ